MCVSVEYRPLEMDLGSRAGTLDAVGWMWQPLGAKPRGLSAQERGRDESGLDASGPAMTVEASARPARRMGWLARITIAAGLIAAAAFVIGFFVFVGTVARNERALSGQADGIVALTGGAHRIGDAIDLLAAGYGRRLLISGVNERTSRDEIARLNPTQRHLIECCVDLDYRARNTIGNAIETRRWMRRHQFASVAVVTSNYHMPRTLLEIEHALMEGESALPYPVITNGFDVENWWTDPAAARLLGAEYLKFLAAWLRMRIETDPESSRFAILIGRGKPVKMVSGDLLRESH